MRTLKYLAIALLSLLLGTSAQAQKNEWLSPFSPGLQKFLTRHPEDFPILTNVVSEAFTNRSVRFFYFYSQDKSAPGAEHFFPDVWEVLITIKANQQPADEFIVVIFESLNAEGDERFGELANEARSGTISKTNFALEIVKQEFVALKQTRDMLGKFRLTKKEIANSAYYKKILETPESFEEFLTYLKKINSSDLIEQYEEKYDLIRNQESITNSPPP